MRRSASDPAHQRMIQQLLAAVGSRTSLNDNDNVAHEPYNWRQVRYFNERQMTQVNEVASNAAQQCAAAYSRLFRNDYAVTAKDCTQHYANEVMQPASEEDQYTLDFGSDPGQLIGVLELPLKTARQWIGQFLGDIPDDSSSRTLSQLEKSLLLDVADGTLKAMAHSCAQDNFYPLGSWSQAQWPSDWEGTWEICRFTLECHKASHPDDISQIHILIPCKELMSLLGDSDDDPPPSEQHTYNTLLAHVHELPISVTARLASTRLSVEETLNLEPGDVVWLDTNINHPIDLTVKDRCLFHGRLAQTDDRYTVVITETVF